MNQQQQQQNHNMKHRTANKEYKHQSIASNTTDTGDESHSSVSSVTRFFFGVLWCFAQVGLWGSVLLFLYYVLKFDTGFAWVNDRRKQFNLHSFLMITGFIFFNGQAMLIYKTFLCCKRIYNKITHTIIFVLSTSVITFGMIVGIVGQDAVPADKTAVHFYSLHSWFGLVTVGLFALQFMMGFISFLVLLCCEKATSSFRAKLLPTHVTMGLIIFSMGVISCLTGLFQTARSRLDGKNGNPNYKDLRNPENPFLNAGIVINLVGVCIMAVAIIMPYIVRNFTHRRNQGSFSIN